MTVKKALDKTIGLDILF